MALDKTIHSAFARATGPENVIDDPVRCRAYECDGLTGYRVVPDLVLLPRDAAAVAAAVRVCAEHGVAFVARGAGTGLSGGALPVADGVVISLSRLRRILEIDPVNRRAVIEPGVTNLEITAAAAPHGLYYAPDPSSQQVCTIGGNVAENSGGAHCLKYGFTTNHVLATEVVLPDGSIVTFGGDSPEQAGPDLRGVFVGSEGTLGITTKITVRLLPTPETVRTLLADFPSIGAAGDVVSDIVAAGIVPAAVEMMDTLAIEAAEQAVHAGYTVGVAAALVVELDGPVEECEVQFDQVKRICDRHGCTRLHIAGSAEERAAIWRGRKAAFAAVGRISPDYFVQDGVVPRTRLGEVLDRIAAMGKAAGLRVANVFHAGDGNLHPLVLYNAAAGETERAERLSAQIAELCVELGGSLSGEHGIGTDKACSMPKMFSRDDLAVMQRVRDAFDPDGLCNPGKVLPTPRLCGERPGPYRPHPLEEAGVIERL
ncbi:FAD-linked oxidase C-terminal domain-containing protein [Pseudonocardia asaccharolytica]|uniref:FAD-binding protein n=1 Tax=Pseudonocardia asaccharolytica DSM 44247 = NBRC 16224 TaxID=1123024 RepID=A0A511D448_9PSEU|nr:FAD-linked oxidase C-terminal domain-containing protein [Pseudonocardia asaccharolytica]GEL19263.1 FAD-binding protein [Pseudonocardia asaccharolytica DSM 44247 = NBRC 16224]